LRGAEPHAVYESPVLLEEYQRSLHEQGIQLRWNL
jgi:hypothetical protein